MLNKFIYGAQFILITGGVVCIAIILAVIIQAIVYRTTKISLCNLLLKSLLK